MQELRFTVISPDKQHINEILSKLKDIAGTSEIFALQGGITALATLGPKNIPDILIFESQGDIAQELAELTLLAVHFPSISFIVLREQQLSDFLLQAMRAGIREVLPLPLSSESLAGAVARTKNYLGLPSGKNGKILAFISCKGGSGSTFLASNLASTLATERNQKVALFDINLQFGDALLFVSDLHPGSTLADAARGIHRLDAAFLSSSMVKVSANFSVLAAPDDPAQSLDILPEHIDALLKLARQEYDFVVIDVGRTLDSRSMKALDHADMIFIVLQITLPFIREGKRLIEIFRTLGYSKNKLFLIVNRYEKGGDIHLSDLEQSLAEKVYRTIPNHYEGVAASVNQGIAIVKLVPNSPVSKALIEWCEVLAPAENLENNWFKRLFKRK